MATTEPPSSVSSKPTPSRFLAGASSLVALQILTRVVTFLLNQALVRLSTPQIFGTASIQFELLLSSILFISREGVRLALLRKTEEGLQQETDNKGAPEEKDHPTDEKAASGLRNRKQKKTVSKVNEEPALTPERKEILTSNIATLPFLTGLPIAIILSTLYAATASPETSSQPYFYASIFAYTIGALLQLAAEPMYILAQQELDFTTRVRSEAGGVIVRAGVTVGILAIAKRMGKLGETAAEEGQELGLISFALGQVSYGALVLGMYLWKYRARAGEWRWVPKSIKFLEKGHIRKQLFDPVLFTLTKSMTLQSLVKHLLTEGDKLAVSRTSKLADQGGYAVASNYGSLVARIIFQPFEEIARVYFSKTLAVCTTDDSTLESESSASQGVLKSELNNKSERIPLTVDQQAALHQASATLHTLLLLESHLFLILLVFLPPYLPILLSHFLPPKYIVTSAPAILQAYAYYLPTMSLNGLLEAFAFSVMSPKDVKVQTRWLFITSVSFALFVWLFCERLGQGDVGLVFANVASLGMRAAWAAWFSDRWFKQMSARGDDKSDSSSGSFKGISMRRVLPPYSVLILFAITSLIIRYSQRFFHIGDDNLSQQKHDREMLKAQVMHIIVGGVCGLICLAECYRAQRSHVRTLLSLAQSR